MRFKVLGIVATALVLFSALAIYRTGTGSGASNTSMQNQISESYVRSTVVYVREVLQNFETVTPEKLAALKSKKELWPEGWLAFKETSQDEALYLKENQSLQGANVQSFLQFVTSKSGALKKEIEIYPWRDEAQKNYFVIFVQRSKLFLAVLVQNPFKGLNTLAAATPDAELSVINEQKEIIYSEKAEYLGQKTSNNPVVNEIKGQGLEQNAALFKTGNKQIWGRYQRIPSTNLFAVRTNPIEVEGFSSQNFLTIAIFGGLSLMVLAILTMVLRKSEKISAPNGKSVTAAQTAMPAKQSVGLPGASAEATSEDKLRAYKRMVASIGNEIRRPLFSIMGKVQVAHQASHDQIVNRDLEKAIDEMRSLRGNLEKLLNFTGEKQWERIDTSLETPLTRALKDFEKKFIAKKIDVSEKLENKDIIPIEIEGLQKVFENLINNSIEAMERMAQKKLAIRLYRENDRIIVSVTDSGEGMDKNTIAQVKEPFFTTRSYAHHMGLGLWQAYSIVKSHGGELEIQSEKGKGTTVKVILPAVPSIPVLKQSASEEIEQMVEHKLALPPLPLEPLVKSEVSQNSAPADFSDYIANELKKQEVQPASPRTIHHKEDSLMEETATSLKSDLGANKDEKTVRLEKTEKIETPKSPFEKDIDDLLELSDGFPEPAVPAPNAVTKTVVSDDKTPVSRLSPPRFQAPQKTKEIDSYDVKVRRPGEKSV